MEKNPHLPGSAEEFIKNNMGLAQKEAWKWIRWVKGHEQIKMDKDDLLGIAYIGLLNAYRRFDPSKFKGPDGEGVKFSTYAVPMIKGEILREIRDRGNTIRKSRDGRGPDTDSLEQPFYNSVNSDEVITLGELISVFDDLDDQIILNDFLATITDERLKKVYELRSKDLSQSEVSKILKLSQVEISRRENKLIQLAQEYGRSENKEMGRPESENTAKMKAELTTLAEFDAKGIYAQVAKIYSINSGTAWTWRKHLLEAADAKKAEKEPQPSSKSEAINKPTEERESISELSEEGGEGECTKEEKEEAETTLTEEKECSDCHQNNHCFFTPEDDGCKKHYSNDLSETKVLKFGSVK